jgi:hypothetical protein
MLPCWPCLVLPLAKRRACRVAFTGNCVNLGLFSGLAALCIARVRGRQPSGKNIAVYHTYSLFRVSAARRLPAECVFRVMPQQQYSAIRELEKSVLITGSGANGDAKDGPDGDSAPTASKDQPAVTAAPSESDAETQARLDALKAAAAKECVRFPVVFPADEQQQAPLALFRLLSHARISVREKVVGPQAAVGRPDHAVSVWSPVTLRFPADNEATT